MSGDKKLESLVGRPGVYQADSTQAVGATEFRRKLSNRFSLADMEQDYTFYTPALIYLSVPLTIDLMREFYAHIGKDVPVYEVVFDKNVFSGLIHPDLTLPMTERTKWCRTVLALSNEYWSQFESWLLQCAFRRTRKDGSVLLYRIRSQRMLQRDPMAIAERCAYTLHAFCVETNQGSFYYQKTAPLAPLQPTFDPLAKWKDTEQFAGALACEELDPYNSQQNVEAPADAGVVQTQGAEPNVAENQTGVTDADGGQGNSQET